MRSLFLGSDISWKRKSGRETVILSKNYIYSRDDFSYWFDKEIDLSFSLQLNFSWLEQGALLLEELASLDSLVGPNETARFKWRLRFLEWIGESLWSGSEEVLHDDVLTLMMSFYYDLPENLDKHFHQFAREVKMRNGFVASYMVIYLICCGYTHHQFLKDIFNTCLFLDYPYAFTMWSEREKKSMTRARANKVLTEIEKSYIVEKNDEYKASILPLLKDSLQFKDSARLLLISFERLDGRGFPKKIDFRNFNDIELSLICLTNSFDYNAEILGHKSTRFIFDLITSNNSFLSPRLSSLVKKAFEQNDTSFKKVVGI